MHDPLQLERPRAQATATGSRVTARVGGADIWFESPDVALRPSVEGFVAAFLLPALELRRPLLVAGYACPEFVAGTRQVVERAHQQWGLPLLPPRYAAAIGELAGARSPRAGLLFSGGINSFHALLASGRHVDDLVFVQGFDLPLTDVSRALRCERSLSEVAEATSTRAIRVRTNLRMHPLFQPLSWERARGGALAAVGHVLSDHITAALVGSSGPSSVRGWSSASLRVDQVAGGFDAGQKLRAIAQEPLLRQHLRVCRENRGSDPNCSCCERCLRTRMTLLAEGQSSDYRVFESDATLAERLDAMERIVDPSLFPVYQTLITRPLPADVALAASRLLARSRVTHRRLRRRAWLGRVGSAARRIWRPSHSAYARPA